MPVIKDTYLSFKCALSKHMLVHFSLPKGDLLLTIQQICCPHTATSSWELIAFISLLTLPEPFYYNEWTLLLHWLTLYLLKNLYVYSQYSVCFIYSSMKRAVWWYYLLITTEGIQLIIRSIKVTELKEKQHTMFHAENLKYQDRVSGQYK